MFPGLQEEQLEYVASLLSDYAVGRPEKRVSAVVV
jgi:hypothetical protein